MSRADWKQYRRAATPGRCECGDAAELHVFFVPKAALGLLVIPAILAKVLGGAVAMVALAGAGAMIALAIAIYAHAKCVACGRFATPEPGRERSILLAIRIGALVACVALALIAYKLGLSLHVRSDVVPPQP
jgi:hypothetical protein